MPFDMRDSDRLVLSVLSAGLLLFVALTTDAAVIGSGNAGVPAAYKVDLNSASEVELMHLSGIGETLAARIVESRQTDGPFRHVDDLQRVHGIGPKTVANLAETVCCLPAAESIGGE